jgi:type II secretory pathway component PulF
VEALVLARFALALHLTLESGMPITRALRLAMEATGNAAFTARSAVVVQALKNGEPLLEALSRSGLFKEEFLHLIAVGEEGGRVPEVMRHQADYYQEEAGRRLTTLTRLATMLVWLIYAIFMVVTIFRIASIYLGALGA